jgi:hypothetical protein
MYVSLPARGILFHHWYGDYSASIGLMFVDEGAAKAALLLLGDDAWKVSQKNPAMLRGSFDNVAVDAVTEKLVSFGAERDKIQSIRFSIDQGEPFTVTVTGEYIPPEQLCLF